MLSQFLLHKLLKLEPLHNAHLDFRTLNPCTDQRGAARVRQEERVRQQRRGGCESEEARGRSQSKMAAGKEQSV